MLLSLLQSLSTNILYFMLHLSQANSFPKPLSAKEEQEELKNLGVQGISKTSQKITLVVGNELALDIEKQFNGSN